MERYSQQRLGPAAVRTGQDPGVAPQRLRVLPGHAQPGRPRRRGGPAAPGRAVRLARGAGAFTAPEQAALAFTEAVTRIGDAGFPIAVWDDVAAHFDEAGIVKLLMAIATINVWNRLAVATHQQLPDLTNTLE